MPRCKQFDIDEALERAKEVFWLTGYNATSMQNLLTEMGINRGSFYDTFKSKHDVYIKVLKRYDEQNRESLFKVLMHNRSPKEAILFIFNEVIENAVSKNGRFGCFLANSVSELAPHNEEVSEICNEAFASTRKFLSILIDEGKQLGEISGKVNSTDLAATLFSLLLGLKVLARSSTHKRVLEATSIHVEYLLSSN